MPSTTWSNDVDPIKTTIYGYQQSMAITLSHSKFRDFSSHTLTGRSFEILNLCKVLKNHEPVHVKHGKCTFLSRGEYPRMRTINLDLIMQKCSWVVQMIIVHKSLQTI